MSRQVCPATVRQLRTRRALSIAELSDASGVSGANLRRIESGEVRHPQMATLRRLAAALGVEVTDLLLVDVAA